VYVYNGAGLEILQSARRGGLFSVVDQTSAAMRWDAKLLMEEAERWPDWATPEDSVEGWEEMSKREEEEWQLADRIICGSRYVADTIKAVGGPVEKCRVVPYGYGEEKDKSGNLKPEKDKNQKAESLNDCVSAPASGFRSHPSSLSARPLRVLFVGTLCLRKGIPYLCEVMGLLKDDKIQFRIVGPSHTTEQGVSSLRQFAEVVGSIPRSALAEHYEWADVLVLPSLSEGSANVCHEAASHGIPMIITPNAGFALENGMAGSIVPIRSPTAIAEALRKTTIRARPPRSATVTQLDDSAQAFVNALA
jgi:glycosyltransferase involved in cell wall biosynthesis